MAPSTPSKPVGVYGCMLVWVALSAAVVMLNKWILSPSLGRFPYPLTLTASHMVFCSVAAYAMVKTGLVAQPPAISTDVYIRTVVPIGALFALTLWLGNLAYVYLSVSYIQILKAVMPLAVYLAGVSFRTETATLPMFANLALVFGGSVIATFGETNFVLLGVAAQVMSILIEATRLNLVQVLLQGTNIRFNPISTMYYVSPVCFGCLLAPMLMLEAPRLLDASVWSRVGPGLLFFSAVLAFALNLSVLLFIGKTSALTMNLAGIFKDWVLIGLSVLLFASRVSLLQLAGYGFTLLGVAWYNHQKFQKGGQVQSQQQQAKQQQATAAGTVDAEAPTSSAIGAPCADEAEAPLLPTGASN